MAVCILYIHGMGGGGDSRIPSILNDSLPEGVDVVVRTYDFHPEVAHSQIVSWVEELRPSMIIGESLGALHALRIKGLPHLFISPSLNAPLYFSNLAWFTFVPGVTALLDWIYRPKSGDRQPLHFVYRTLKAYSEHRKAALSNTTRNGSADDFFAFFGTRDHYRRSGIVSIRTWKKYFGPDSYAIYDGTHFMEEEFIHEMLVSKIKDVLGIA